MRHALSSINNAIKNHTIKNLYIAYSGGVDSSALLHLASQVNESVNIHAIHIHHGLSPNADNWLAHCQKESTKLGIGFITHRLTPPKEKSNIESWARSERYAFFANILHKTPNSLLLTAHHMEDQAETFLLQALRGTGLKGLASIAACKPFANGFLLRPFLHLGKNELIHYCQEHKLMWIEDESNHTCDYRRNAIRLKVMPKLNNILPSASKTLARSAKLCAEANVLLHELLAPELAKLTTENGSNINLAKLNNYSPLQRNYLLKLWFSENNCHPSQAQFSQIYAGVQQKQSNWHYALQGKYLSIQNKQLLMRDVRSDAPETMQNNDTIIQWLNEHLQAAFKPDELIIRQRQSGDRCRPLHRQKSQSLKVIFQEHGISASARSTARIITSRHSPAKIIAIYPFFVCH